MKDAFSAGSEVSSARTRKSSMASLKLKWVAVASIASSTVYVGVSVGARKLDVMTLTFLTSSPDLITRKQLLMICQLVFGMAAVLVLRDTGGLDLLLAGVP